jgi:uncharacterized membrane protein YdbT with pleckstrin-like domain
MFIRPLSVALFGLLCLSSPDLRPIGFICIILAILASISPWITYTSSEFAVTNKRVIVKAGFIRRVSLELLLTKVESISVNQGILGRIMGYGTIEVRGTGNTKERIPNIADPLGFRRKVQEQIPVS